MDRVHGEIHDIACTHYQTTYLHIIVPLVHIEISHVYSSYNVSISQSVMSPTFTSSVCLSLHVHLL